MLPLQLLSLECRGACRGFSIKKPHRCLLSSLGGVWKVLGDGSNLVLSNLERILTWNQEDGRWRRDGMFAEPPVPREHCSENWPLSCPACFAPAPLPPSTNTTMPQWHGWYEGNCGFCLIPGHMQTIKNSRFQNLPQVNELLIQVSSSRMKAFRLPSAKRPLSN